MTNIQNLESIQYVAKSLKYDYNIDSYFVGGCCRDWIMGNEPDDVDICLVGGETAQNINSLLDMYEKNRVIDKVTSVHGDFPIWIVEIDGEKYEFAMARTERKTGQSHQEFTTEVKDVSITQDLYRRDLTINAIAKHVVTGEVFDPFSGINHINSKIAFPCSLAFGEDPLRVIRAARFIARFDLEVTEQLLYLCKQLKPEGISAERVGIELMKMFKTAEKPSKFFYFLKEVSWLNPWFKELSDCIGVPQSPKHHPEGDVFTHIMYCIDAVPKGNWFMRAVMLCHDLGKATKTTVDGQDWEEFKRSNDYSGYINYVSMWKIASAGHEAAGVPLTRDMLQRIHFCDHATIRKIACLVELHMLRAFLNGKNFEKMIRRTMRKLMHYGLKYKDLIEVIYYDLSGRPPKPVPDKIQLYLDMFYQFSVHLEADGEMEPIVTGKKLLDLGLEANQTMGEVIRHGIELQDRGTLKKHNWVAVMKGAHPHYFRDVKL